jgi:hypothetical protein
LLALAALLVSLRGGVALAQDDALDQDVEAPAAVATQAPDDVTEPATPEGDFSWYQLRFMGNHDFSEDRTEYILNLWGYYTVREGGRHPLGISVSQIDEARDENGADLLRPERLNRKCQWPVFRAALPVQGVPEACNAWVHLCAMPHKPKRLSVLRGSITLLHPLQWASAEQPLDAFAEPVTLAQGLTVQARLDTGGDGRTGMVRFVRVDGADQKPRPCRPPWLYEYELCDESGGHLKRENWMDDWQHDGTAWVLERPFDLSASRKSPPRRLKTRVILARELLKAPLELHDIPLPDGGGEAVSKSSSSGSQP